MTAADPARTRVADVVARTLAAHGVRHVFGMPGGEVVEIVDALGRAGIDFTLARHETAAAAMAAGAWAATGRPALLVTTIGPGLANAVDGIADAAQERVPLVVLSGVVDRTIRGRFTHQVIDHRALLAPLVKTSVEIEAEGAGATVARALAAALDGPAGPVHLDLSPGVAATVVDRPADTAAPGPTAVLHLSPRAGDPAVGRIADRIATARRPLIVAGFAAALDHGGGAVATLAEAIGAAVVTTYKAKGAIPEDHPLALGAAGLSPAADAILMEAVRAADLVILIGYDPIEMRVGWLDAFDPARTVEIAPHRFDHGMHRAALRLEAPVAATAAALVATIGGHQGWPRGEVEALRARLAARFAGPDRFGPHAIVATLRAHVGDGDVVTVDSGAHRILLSQLWTARRPVTLLQSAGFCTMATALPTAIGAKIAAPERRVVAVMGDGGLEMGLGELATLRDCGLPLTVVVFQDESLALIALKQKAAGLARAGVDIGPTDFAALARAFGGHGATVTDAAALARELDDARVRDRFSLLACRFDADEYDGAF
ncbi:thiamine pyrophosphate-binding protein [Oharaeibacter diazotrophicus]|uniref:Acetolactate synthase-1/2/3 large subunit n=3 Tax=Oharaeibacter diazotrophicus TaxID=1920512 RepID=A0A4R6RK16_9HYPH|nr:thiamine pyrophosphate-binding protein [Oharaeibacter diazotrophicus]TDP86257.1 acetolactate synthase-1/2/3 large subunit [Oharaeibacter diazotrophicus]BBE71802.1 acetolactate synthase [Pleomorphomonas sp. SM30]GLS78567.1 acetolactate synthase [Oharaeibacter diazotrophicus]